MPMVETMKPDLRRLCQLLKSTSENLLQDPLDAQPLGQLRRQLREDINNRLNASSAIEDSEVLVVEYVLLRILDDMWATFSGVVSAIVSRQKMRDMLNAVATSLRSLSDSLEKGDVSSCHWSYSSLLSTFLNMLKEGE
jgi:hypothetical protein